MKTSNILIPTQKELPNDAQIISHQLMIKAGLISKLASGLYSYLPLGLRVLQKIENIVREEMNKSGAQEILMPMVQPAELWQESGRWDKYGAELLRFKDRHNRDFCLGPTHEEVIVDIAKQYLRSYKALPINLYQIQTKFRDEIRPRFGLMRSREFLMKDAYSFHIDKKSMQFEFDKMQQTYINIFTRIGLNFRAVIADSGSIGGENSIEFHVLADSGEDYICFSDKSDYAANIEKITFTKQEVKQPTQELVVVKTPNIKTVNEVSNFLQVDIKKVIKTLILKNNKNQFIAIALRGDHQLNKIKAEKIIGNFSQATTAELEELGLKVGFIGVLNLGLPIFVDYAAYAVNDFICGANQYDAHITGVNWQRDVTNITPVDFRQAVNGDKSPCGNGKLKIKKGIEVGHIFQLGDVYSKAMNANIIGEKGKAQIVQMGCYGIGISRILAAIIEQNFDTSGIIFPEIIAPFQLIIVPINYNKSTRVASSANKLYQYFLDSGIEVLLDDRKERPGVMFKDSELIGIPHRLVISDTHVDNGMVEYKERKSDKIIEIKFSECVNFIKSKL